MGEFELMAPEASALIAPPAGPTAEPLRALQGIDWQGVAAEARGQVAMFDVTDPGTLQEWKTRKEVAGS